MNSTSINSKTPSSLNGVTWFPVRSRKDVNLEVERLKFEGITSIRLGIDCAKFNTKKGLRWYDWLVPTLAESFHLELCFDNFSFAPEGTHSKRHSLSEIVEHFIIKHGQHFNEVELWRNPAKRANEEICENIYSEDVVFTATWAKRLGKKVSLGGIQTVDFEWITKLISCQFLSTVDYLKIDKETEDDWSTNTRFYERTLRSLFEAKGVKTQIKTSEIPMRNLLTSGREIAC
ncbi:hypothetical protein [Algoriphagus winogradskyi]|uniref:Uncharacterized protein n=1 Tax=Algoriphagus winogradskyi TaxID=237017 RepID=A0ABY1P1Y0_9BACT|nr:hypothetical protein [Algoriphagus winogradskyi]SMP22952.1 hypothetical protein SAMN06265367_103520 [Algoriphagus winogradskyi]